MITLIAPHNDDEGLYATYICLRLKPRILVVFDATTHEARFGKTKGVVARRRESIAAAKILRCEIDFVGLPDTQRSEHGLEQHIGRAEHVITPAYQGGNPHHDLLSAYGQIHYATYTKDNLTPYIGDGLAIRPTPEEVEIKRRVLACYVSQHDINKPHFEAVENGEPEYIQGVLTAPIRRALRLDE